MCGNRFAKNDLPPLPAMVVESSSQIRENSSNANYNYVETSLASAVTNT